MPRRLFTLASAVSLVLYAAAASLVTYSVFGGLFPWAPRTPGGGMPLDPSVAATPAAHFRSYVCNPAPDGMRVAAACGSTGLFEDYIMFTLEGRPESFDRLTSGLGLRQVSDATRIENFGALVDEYLGPGDRVAGFDKLYIDYVSGRWELLLSRDRTRGYLYATR